MKKAGAPAASWVSMHDSPYRSKSGTCCPARPLPSQTNPTYIQLAVLRGACWTLFPGALSISLGAVPALVRGLGHMAPTYVVGTRDRCPTAFVARASSNMKPSSKAQLRAGALERRAAVSPDLRAAFSTRAADEGLRFARERRSQVASAYWPIRGEADPLALLTGLARADVLTALPVLGGRGKALLFRQWRPGEPLIDRAPGLREPPPSAANVHPDLLFVPLAAFDRSGHRLGYGAGYYDATLAALEPKSPLAIGLAFACQEVAFIPAEAHDHPLAFVITERETIDCRKQTGHADSIHR